MISSTFLCIRLGKDLYVLGIVYKSLGWAISNVNDKVNENTTNLPIPSRNSTRYVLIVVEIEDVLDRQCSVLTPIRLVMYILYL